MTRRKRPDEFDDDGVRVTDQQGRRIRGRNEWERAVLAEARHMRATGQSFGKVSPPPVAAALDLEQLAEAAARLRRLLAEVDARHLDATPTMRARIEAAAVALEALHDEPAPVDLDQLP